MTINLLVLAEIAGSIGAIAAVLGLFYRKIDKTLLSPVKQCQEDIKRLESWTAKQQEDIISNRECGKMQIVAIRACLDGLIQQGCNGKVTQAAKQLDEYIIGRAGEMKSKHYGG